MSRRKILLLSLLFCVTAAPVVYAQTQYSIKEMTPDVQTALENRRNRYEDLKILKQNGLVGENNRGYVDALTEDASAKELVTAENKDRKIIYETIVEQNDLQGALETIEKTFAQVQREKADAGDKIQMENGDWATK